MKKWAELIRGRIKWHLHGLFIRTCRCHFLNHRGTSSYGASCLTFVSPFWAYNSWRPWTAQVQQLMYWGRKDGVSVLYVVGRRRNNLRDNHLHGIGWSSPGPLPPRSETDYEGKHQERHSTPGEHHPQEGGAVTRGPNDLPGAGPFFRQAISALGSGRLTRTI